MPAITLSRPVQGQVVTVSATDKSAKIALGFSTDDVTLSRDGNSLIFTFEDAAAIRIDDFYTSYHSDSIPEFEIDGKLVSGAEFFSALGPDLIPAAGPSPVERSSRYTEHDNADLASGIDHLGSLDYSTESSGFYDASPRMGGAEPAAAPSASEGAGGGSGGQEPSSTYHTRLVVTATSANTFSFFAVDQDGNIVNDPSQISNLGFEGANTYFIITGIAADGRITVELTAAGLAALNNGTLASDMLLISVDGVEYKMPLLITGGSAGQSYDAAAEENRVQLGGDLKAEWYASDARTVSGENVTLGGTSYNQVDIDRSDAGGAGNIGVWNSDIDITASATGAVNITARHNTGNAYGLATYENSGQASSSVLGGEESSIHISAQTTGTSGTAYGVHTNSNQGANAATTVEGGDIAIEAHGNEDGAYGIYAWAAGGREASTTVKAAHDLTITADSSKGDSSGPGNTAVYATGGGAKITISSGPDGTLQVASHLENSTQEHFNVEKGGSFAVSGISAYNGGQVSATGADINISSDVNDSSAHGTATAVYAGYGNARTTISGYDDRDNHMEFSSSAPDHAITVIGTNSGVVAINGGSGDDTIKISSEARFGSSFGVAAQAGGQVLINGNGGHDELHIDARFNGPAKPGTTELFDGGRGAYGMASAWGGAWVKVDGIETVNITADARGSGGSAYGMYTRGNGWGAADGNIIQYDGSLHATISGYADNPADGHAMHASGGENIIQGGSRLGDADGDRITLNGHMTTAGYNGKNLVTTGDGDDIVTLNGNMAIKNVANDGMQNKIETGLGNDVVRVSGSMIADKDNGQNIINVGAGDNMVEIGGDMRGVGTNSLILGSGDSTVNLGGRMAASGVKGVNSIQGDASGNTVVNVNGQGAALHATGGGKNSISGVHDVHADSGYIYATGSGSSNRITDIAGAVTTTMLAADNSGSNAVTNVGSLDIQAAGSGSIGIYAGQNASNIVDANGGIDINAQSSSGGTWGLMAGALGGNATNSLKAGADIHITATGNGTSADAIDNNSGNTTSVESTGGDVSLKATSTSSAAQGIWGIGTTTVTAGKNLTIEAATQGNSEARGVHTGGTTTLTAQDGDVTIRAEGDMASGIYTVSTGTTSVSASGLIDIQAHGKSGSYYIHGGNATALYAESQNTGQLARNIIEGGEVSITAKTLQNGGTYALYSNTALNKITGDTRATVTAENSGTGDVWGMYATATNNKLGANEVAGHDVTVSSSAANGNAYAMQASSSQGDSANTVTLSGGTANINAASAQGNAYAMHAEGRGTNTITGNGDVNVVGNSDGNKGYGMYATSSGSNIIATGSGGDVTVTSNGASGSIGMNADYSGSKNTITTTTGAVTVTAKSDTAPATGMSAGNYGSSSITTTSGDVTVTGESKNGSGTGMRAFNTGSNKIETVNGNVTVSAPAGLLAGLVAASGGTNAISTSGGKVSVSANNTGLQATGAGSSNDISGKDIDITARASSSNGLLAEEGGRNSVSGYGGNVALSGGNVLRATGAGSENRLAVGNGSIAFKSWSGNINWAAGNPLLYYTDTAAHTSSGGQNIITGYGGTGISFTGQGFGLRADSGGSNSVTTDGDVTFSGITQALTASGTASGNTLNADNIVIDSKVYADRSVAAVDAKAGGQNTLAASPGGAITITTSAATGSERDPYSTSINDTASVRADGAGSHNTLSADTISLDNQCGKGLAATNGGVNTLESASGSPLTVTITASADAAEKAIAMWADGGGSVNYITGHSQAGGTGDSITLTANNGQGIAMQAENGGQNIITTGAGNDSVTINGNIVGDGNEINLGGGSNILTINGMVQPGSLNVLATGGTYTLILQAADTQGFIDQYGEWLDAFRASVLFSGGLEAINFEGLDGSDLADFLDVFNDVLWDLKDNSVDIQPPDLADALHDPAGSPIAPTVAPLAATLAETDAGHHTQDAQHAAGHDAAQDSAQDATLATHDGPMLLTDDGLNTAFNAPTDNAGTHTDVPGPDATALAHFSEDAEEQVQPLFAFLDGHTTDTSASMPLEEGDDALHNGYLGNEGENSGNSAGLHAPITLTYGDESLDSLFTAAGEQNTELAGTGLESDTLHDMGLTDMSTALDQNPLVGPEAASGPAAAAGGLAAAASEVSDIPSVMDSCQETTDNAVREMANT